MKKAVVWFTITTLTVFAVYVSIKMISFGSSYNGIANVIVNDTVGKTGAINAVTAIVFDFRGYDTLGESFVLFTAITAAAAILRKPVNSIISKGKGGK
ncbi:putative monovalent cation/H+ antiporter subunit B [Clostridium tepidiprofundi DSM 19306]|uniref:Putative monovalent cation/H+ antiporter subunit B n=1 Tax=Clostridium tepidiprofundi DSM 19306 TaxID=1121338 RepID=A0A151B6S7_9CLOT|nr:hydrogen gas-evolving membrane-bound hydrogenase subunit E [Clostridium tepidiprofundi]KYH35638.1 putative monovalent cation/H+ antiporter subunit B [Clostridium tepidiprofundi DSM 19306]